MYTSSNGKEIIDVVWDICVATRARIVVQVMIYRRLRIGRDGHLDQSEAGDIS